jgi:hypothetical protein
MLWGSTLGIYPSYPASPEDLQYPSQDLGSVDSSDSYTCFYEKI